MKTEQMTHDHRKIHHEVYGTNPGPVTILTVPKLKFVSQEMTTAYRKDWFGRPEPIDQTWVVWKIINQLKHITKNTIDYRFKLMPHEIIWHDEQPDGRSITTQMMQVPELITEEMYEKARENVERNLKGIEVPATRFEEIDSFLCAQKLHVGHYKDSYQTLKEITEIAEDQGYHVKKSHREIYLTPAMRCHPPATWRTIVQVELEKRD